MEAIEKKQLPKQCQRAKYVRQAVFLCSFPAGHEGRCYFDVPWDQTLNDSDPQPVPGACVGGGTGRNDCGRCRQEIENGVMHVSVSIAGPCEVVPRGDF